MRDLNAHSPAQFDVALACDPHRSVVVSACAGSGKTWLLVARMVRLLLAGTKPQEILALTFTRKAAQEMRARLYGLLAQFAQASDTQLLDELTKRGLNTVQATALLPNARKLYAQVLASPQGIVIDTFHGWFGRLLGAAPVSTGIRPGFSLREDSKRLQAECLDDWWGDLPVTLKNHYDVLLAHLGAHETQQFLLGHYSLFKQRGAWAFYAEACAQKGLSPLQQLEQDLPMVKKPNPLLALWNAPNIKADLDLLLHYFSNSNATERGYISAVQTVIDCKSRDGDVMEIISLWQNIFLNLNGGYRLANNKVAGELSKFLKREKLPEAEHIAFKQSWGEALIAYIAWQKDQIAYALNQAWFAMSAAMMEHLKQSKEALRVRDFDDLEIDVSRLMNHAVNAAYLQARLDAKYKHILVDEFQDTNPLQWQILRSWLDGYGHDESKPSVFIVGDPKQSIYRFRRADPRLFQEAENFLQQELKAATLNQNSTRRNAMKVNEAVNAIFTRDQLPDGYPFVSQTTTWKTPPIQLHDVSKQAEAILKMPYSLQGEAALLPLIPQDVNVVSPRQGSAFDEAIVDVRQTADVLQRYTEGKGIAALIHHVMQTRMVLDADSGDPIWRKPQPSDFLILVKRRKYIPQFELALRESGLAFESSRLGGLLNTLEVDDLIALLTILVTPRHDLPLAQVLRSPLFNFSEEQMQVLAGAMAGKTYRSWWDALQHSADHEIQQAARYLEHWRILGERLPVHDLLDCIFHERDLRMRYAQTSKTIDRPQVLANLDAFMNVALNLDGGRYPSLSHFIAEINLQRRGDDDETPDEGEVDFSPGDTDALNDMLEEERHQRVRLMTIHGAKGLEAPFVMVLDANHTAGIHEHRGVLLDWPANQSSPSHLSMYTLDTLTSPRSEIRDNELAIAKNENCNLLYVAMTRAKQGLWISGVAHSKGNDLGVDEKSWYGRALQGNLPLLEETLLAPVRGDIGVSQKNIPQEKNQAGVVFSIDDFQIKWEAAKVHQQQLIGKIEEGIVLDAFASAGYEADLNPDILEQGKHFHRLMEIACMQTGVSPASLPDVQELAVWFNIDKDLASLALERAQTVLNTPALKPYLTAGDWIAAWNELDLMSASGKNFRLDRLVEFPDRLVILDFKLTIPSAVNVQTQAKADQYRVQLDNYAQELTRIRPDKVVEAYLISATGEMQQII